jgi:hypothetical protein
MAAADAQSDTIAVTEITISRFISKFLRFFWG